MSEAFRTQRDAVLDAMRRRPNDHWPRGTGHVLLGWPGSPREQKAYHEPGGSFSPSPGSFGVSIWLRDRAGAVVATSDSVAPGTVAQSFCRDNAAAPPALLTRTPEYECRWWTDRTDRWLCRLTLRGSCASAAVVVRSSGPAGGPLSSLWRERDRLVVNHRWVLETQPACAAHLVDEEETGWQECQSGSSRVESAGGWAAGRFELGQARELLLSIRDTAPSFEGGLRHEGVGPVVRADLPDPEFAATLDAQATHLLMGCVGRQTCPGEPVNYPLAWERDGAYSVMAMARCGQVQTAMDLARYFAENDFFGGFGAEGDGPGSAINALVGVALVAADDEFSRSVWPHVERKVGYIDEMLAAAGELDKPWVGPICPHLLKESDIPTICKSARDGLIVGSMDRHYPVLYITAMSYRGLRQAARLARMLGKAEQAGRFDSSAARIRQAWLAHFADADLANERTYMSSLWPTWIVPPQFAPFRAGLQQRWDGEHGQGSYPQRPLWTYFTHAEAHQWLFLQRPDIVWKTLRYFRANQCSPGLYSWWEGEGEENTFGLWPQVRGWVKPPHVTPHYWTASESLLLHLDMLAHVDESGDTDTLVVGAGVPPEWIGKPMSVTGLPTSAGVVDWCCEGNEAVVTVHGDVRPPVRPGPSLAGHIRLQVRYA